MTRGAYRPDGWPTLVPRVTTREPKGLVEFVRQVFDATGAYHAERPTELRIGDSMLMISASIEREEMTAFLYVYVPDVDATHRRALDLGATEIEAPQDLPYGDRRGMLRDRWGNTWQIATDGGRFTPEGGRA